MRRLALALCLAILGIGMSPALADEIPKPGPHPFLHNVYYDREGVPYHCVVDPDPELGCMYKAVEEHGGFTLYWVGKDGMKFNFWIKAMERAWVRGYEWFSEPHYMGDRWRIWWQDAPYHTVGSYELMSDNAQNYMTSGAECDCPDGVC